MKYEHFSDIPIDVSVDPQDCSEMILVLEIGFSGSSGCTISALTLPWTILNVHLNPLQELEAVLNNLGDPPKLTFKYFDWHMTE